VAYETIFHNLHVHLLSDVPASFDTAATTANSPPRTPLFFSIHAKRLIKKPIAQKLKSN
jgi:hypothetical protein